MKNEQSKLGELFQKAFDDFKPEPSAGVWEKISQRPELLHPIKPSAGTSWWKVFLGGAGLTAVIIAVVLTFRTSDKPVEPAQSAPAPAIATPLQDNKPTTSAPQTVTANTPEKVSVKSQTAATEKVTLQKPDQVNTINKILSPIPASQGITTERINTAAPVITEKQPGYSTGTSSSATTLKNDGSKTPAAPSSENNIVTNPYPKEGIEVIQSQQWCKGESLTLWAKGGTSYLWNTGETTESINVTLSSTSNYSVTVTDHSGQPFHYDITITVVECKDIYIPTAFSPNNDGVNDIFKVTAYNINEITNFHLVIVSRTGQILYETKDINEGWDGKVKGKIAEMGVYVSQVTYTDSTGKEHKITKPLTLLGND